MLIQCQGHLIDTTKIYDIPLVCGGYLSPYNNPSRWQYSMSPFTIFIKFIGGTEVKIVDYDGYNKCKVYRGKYPLPQDMEFPLSFYEKRLKIMEDMRDQIVAYWNTSKSDIPEVKMNNDLI